MHQPGAARCRPELWSGVCWESRLLIFLALFLLLLPSLHGRLHPLRGEVLMTRREQWLLCGTVVLDPKDFKWSCCRDFYPFHRPTQRCCQTWDKFIVIPTDPQKSEAEDYRTYTQETPE